MFNEFFSEQDNQQDRFSAASPKASPSHAFLSNSAFPQLSFPFVARHTSHSHLKQPNPHPSFAGTVPRNKAEAATWHLGEVEEWEDLFSLGAAHGSRSTGHAAGPQQKTLSPWKYLLSLHLLKEVCDSQYLQYYLWVCFFFSVSEKKKSRNVCQFKVPFLGHPGFSDHKFSVDHALFSDTERRRTSLLILYCSSYCWTSEDFGLCSISLQRQQYVSNFAPSNFPNQYAVL